MKTLEGGGEILDLEGLSVIFSEMEAEITFYTYGILHKNCDKMCEQDKAVPLWFQNPFSTHWQGILSSHTNCVCL